MERLIVLFQERPVADLVRHQDGELSLQYRSEVYAHLDARMAMSIGGMFDDGGLTPAHWAKEIRKLGLPQDRTWSRILDLRRRVIDTIPAARGWIVEQGVDDTRLDGIEGIILRRAAILVRGA